MEARFFAEENSKTDASVGSWQPYLYPSNILISFLIKIFPSRLYFACKNKLNYFEYLSIQNAVNLLLMI